MKKVKMSQIEVLNHLDLSKKKMISKTISRYQNGPLANIFNEFDVSALAEDVAMEVARRVENWNKGKKTESVDPKGAKAYFCRAFINHCQKIYEKHAKTDIRAGIKTVSSEEALTVAASKNLITPENDYLLRNEINYLLKQLQSEDLKINTRLISIASKENRKAKPEELQHSFTIISKMLEGFEPNEIRQLIKLSEQDYARHRKSALDLCKSFMTSSLSDLLEHVEVQVDYRVLTREVQKRKKNKNRKREYSLENHYFVESKFDNKTNTCQTALFVQINVMEGEQKSPDFKPQRFKLLEEKTTQMKAAEMRKKLWEKTKDINVLSKVDVMGKKLIQQ